MKQKTFLCSLFLMGAMPVLGHAQMMAPPQVVQQPVVSPILAPPTVKDYSLIYIDEPEPREYKIHDIVTVIVSEKSEVTLNSRFNRQRTGQLTAELKEFVKIGPEGNLENAAANSPTIDASLAGRLQNSGQVTEQEGITYRIAATVVDILPNGNMVLEARKEIDANGDAWEYRLTGTIRFEDILTNNTVLSENVANLQIAKKQRGRIRNSTGMAWGLKLYDLIRPF